MWFKRRRRDGDGKKLKTAVFTNMASGLFCLDCRDRSGEPPVVFIDLDYDINEKGAVTLVAASYTVALDKLQ
ncbi:SMI1/KNR4 family protein [Rhizobium terrae]|uniref:hypothetical protein n=1 Tax=Rhizobium terrae TaxID=2171756 RepID=UPI000E3E325E|nr:hypothetical protein [Rhizobium terrae]